MDLHRRRPAERETLSAEDLVEINRICDLLEADWRANGRASIEARIAGTPPALRAALLRELLTVEIEYRRSIGDAFGPDDYLGRFPADATIVEAALAGRFDPTLTAPGLDPDATEATSGRPIGLAPVVAAGDGPRFRVLRPHARGGLGAVYVALDGELNREVALKQLLDDRADEPTSRRRFVAEAEITGGLEHPGIVPVYGLGYYPDGRPFYAMRFIRGGSLKEAIERFHAGPAKDRPGHRALELRKLLRRFTDVCNAIDYAHSRGVLHRDIKPGNIVLGRYGETLVIDWGLAKAMAQPEGGDGDGGERALMPPTRVGVGETQPGTTLGTPAYMSPEQADGRLDRLGPRADVYSLGATLYCLLTGRPPIEDGRIGEVLDRVRRGVIAKPRHVDPSIDPALEAICLKAMARMPEDRYNACRALAEDVERWAAEEPVSAWREPAIVRLRRWMRRHRTAVMLAGAILASAVVALSIGLIAVDRERGRTVEALDNVRREKARADLALVAETEARRRTREALDATTSEVVEKFLSTGDAKLGPDQEAFLAKTLASYREFAAGTGSSEQDRASVAAAHGRVGTILYKMGQPLDARAAWGRAVALYGELTSAYPDRAAYRIAGAKNRHNIAVVDLGIGRLKEAEQALREDVVIQEKLAAEDPKDPRLVRDLCMTFEALGNVLDNSGRGPDAEAAYAAAEGKLRPLGPAPEDRSALSAVLLNRASAHFKAGRIAEAESCNREAAEIRRRLASDHPREIKYRSDFAFALNELGLLCSRLGKVGDAEAAFREALPVARRLAFDFPTVPDHRYRLSNLYDNYAISCSRAGRMLEAEAAFRDRLAVARQLAEDFPDVLRYREGHANGWSNLGVILAMTGRPGEAAAAYRASIAILRTLTARAPEIAHYRRALGRGLFNLSLVPGEEDQAAVLRECVEVFRPLAAQPPRLHEDRFHLAKVLMSAGSVSSEAGREPDAEAPWREADEILATLVAESPKVAIYREEFANNQDNLGLCLKAIGRVAEAETSLRAGIANFGRLIADVPNYPHYGKELASIEGNLSDLLADLGRYAEALEWARRAAPRLDAALKANPDGIGYKKASRLNRIYQARALAGLGEPAAAREVAEGIGQIGSEEAEEAFTLACALARCVPPGRDDPSRFADRAMAALRRAVEAGYRHPSRLRTAREIDCLRDRDDFARLIMDAGFPDRPFVR